MKNFSDPWTARFEANLSDKRLRESIRVPASPVNDLATRDRDQAIVVLRQVLKDIVVPTSQVVAVIRRLIGSSRAYCELAFHDSQTVLRRMYDPESFVSSEGSQAICLTGLAGVGKSVILDSFAKLHAGTGQIAIDGHGQLQLRALWRLRIRDRVNFGQLIPTHFRNTKERETFKHPPMRAIVEATAQGIGMLLADEFQFITQGKANVMMAKLLLQLTQIGPPMVFACNCSMLQRLATRPQQERDRLLSHPIVVSPEAPGADWTEVLTEMFRAAPEFSSLDPKSDGTMLNSYSHGILRALRRLLELAYAEMRHRVASVVTRSDIEKAYLSTEYSSMKRDVENIRAGVINRANLRKEFLCPFEWDLVTPAQTGPVAHPGVQEHSERSAAAALTSVLPPREKEALEVIKNAHQARSATDRRIPRPQATVENLLGGAERFARASTQKEDPDP